MKTLLTLSAVGAALVAAQPAASQGIGHTFFMRGQIVEVGENGTVVCVGKADRAQVDQVLDVYRVRISPGPQKPPAAAYRRERVGQVTIDHIFNDHFAHARVTNGTPRVHDIVELRRR
jgi:hypothetical protein